MAISCTVLIFSGRPNPEWRIDDEPTLQALLKQLRQLPGHTPVPDFPSKLGYQGCRFRVDDEQWAVQQGIVWRDSPGPVQGFADADRRFEKALLNTAPEAYSALIFSLLSSEF